MMKTFFRDLSLAALMVLAVPSALAVDLAKVYEDAVLADPTLKEAAANRMATLESKPQALAALLPQFDGQYVYDKQYNGGSSTFSQVFNDPITGNPVVQNITTGFTDSPDNRQFWQLRVNQTLFRWDQFIALKQADKQVARAEAQYRAAQQDLMVRSSQRYFNVLGARATLVAGEAARDSIGRQLEQAEKRFEVGLIAITDVQESQASYDSAVAGVIEAKRTMATAQEFLREITGEYYKELADAGPNIPLIPPNPADVEVWVETSRSRNLTLEASRIATDITRDQISIRKSGHMPTLDFFASRGKNNDKKDRETRPDQITGGEINKGPANQKVYSDVLGIQLNVPLFSGGAVRSNVKEAVYLHRASQEQLERVARETERQVRDAYLSVTSEIARVRALARSVESNETALRATEAGFEVGTRTTVDVLDSRRNLFEAQRDYAQSRYAYVVNALLLKQAAGNLSPTDINEINGWLTD